jgi:hypothetical protein
MARTDGLVGKKKQPEPGAIKSISHFHCSQGAVRNFFPQRVHFGHFFSADALALGHMFFMTWDRNMGALLA